MRWFLRQLLRLLFGFRAYNEEVLNTPGPVLLIPNHVSWLDWLFLYVCTGADWKCVVSSISAQTSWVHRKIMINRRTFPIDTNSPYAVKRMAEYLEGKGRLALFAEGRLSRTGVLMKLFEGTGFLLHKTGAKVITCYLRRAHRLPFSPNSNAKHLFPRVSAHFSEALTPPHMDHMSTADARTHLTTWLRDKLVEHQFDTEMEFGARNVLEAVAARGREFTKRIILADINNQQLTYRVLLVGARLLANRWSGLLRGQRIGVLLPNVNAMPVVTLSLWAAGRVPAILNYSTGTPVMLACAQLAGLKQVVTSRTFLGRAKINIAPLQAAGVEFIYVEDVRKTIKPGERVAALFSETFFKPAFEFSHAPEETAVILFTSGSEGVPKGVELSHRNLLSNIRQMLSVIDLMDTDRFFNALPLFHSFGLTVGTLLPLVRGLFVFLYPSPLHYRVVPTAFYNLDCTVMFGTNTFLNGYARKAHPYDFRALRYLFAGAEKLQESTANVWMRRFGVRVIEGYGATECSPCVTANTPIAPMHGSAGRFLPRIEHRFEPVEGVPEGGRLHVRGPNVMKGYLNVDANEQFKKLGGWYDTGDIAKIDEEGFLFILGRLKRFAKISGEMVSLTAVEEALAGAFPEHGLRCQIAIISKPDPDKGEILIAITNESKLTIESVRVVIRQKGLPNIAMPRELKLVKEIPKLGTGKTNHRELEKIV